jgi:uncharacterized damage-inducible protein DinB
MAEESLTLTTFYDNWKVYQDDLKAAIAPLTAAQLALRAAPSLRPIGEIAAHIIAARVAWFNGCLGEGGQDVAPMRHWDEPGGPLDDTPALLRGFDISWKLMAGALARWSPADMRKTFGQEWRGDHYVQPRSWVVWHVLEHDLHHGGEVSLTLGMHGLQVPEQPWGLQAS